MRVLKIGGNELDSALFLEELGRQVARSSEKMVIVHGGGQAISTLHDQLGLPTIKIEGLRVTDARSMGIVEMVLSGQSNKLLVRALLVAGVRAVGVSGVDAQILRAQKKEIASGDLGFVGEVIGVNTALLETLLSANFFPVVSPISLGEDGHPYNVNADPAATAIAAALKADQIDFISNVAGVLQDGKVIDQLTTAEAEGLIAQGVISGGMIPKVRAALDAVEQGVKQARIVNLAGLLAGGTTFR